MEKSNKKLIRKKILFIEGNQDGTVGGSHHSLIYLIKALNKNKYEPMVMFYERSQILNQFNDDNCSTVVFFKPLGKSFHTSNIMLKLPFLIYRKVYNLIITSFIPFVKFSFFLIKNKIELIHLNNSAHAGWEWLFAAKLLRRKCITHQRGFIQVGRIEKIIVKLFDKIICISKAIETNLKENGIRNNLATIYNTIDTNDFKSKITNDSNCVRKKIGIEGHSPIIGMVGNFHEWKGQIVVIRAVDKLRLKYKKIVCLIIGGVSTNFKNNILYYEKVKKEIDDKKLGKNVIITGYRPDVANLINALDVMIHASIEPEPFGRVIIEGMSLKKPVIATDLGGAREIIEDGISGILVPPNSPNVLAEKIEYLLEHPHFKNEIVANALIRVKEIFGFNHFVREINSLYKQILR